MTRGLLPGLPYEKPAPIVGGCTPVSSPGSGDVAIAAQPNSASFTDGTVGSTWPADGWSRAALSSPPVTASRIYGRADRRG